MTRRTLIVGITSVAALLLLGAGVAIVMRAPVTPSVASTADRRSELDSAALAPEGVRVRVRVLNATDRTGLARRATQRLRDHGYDVVEYTNRPAKATATQVETSPGMRDVGERLVRALGAGSVTEAAAPLPYADVLVVLGSDWQPPPQPLRP
jgi:hypothetical protein